MIDRPLGDAFGGVGTGEADSVEDSVSDASGSGDDGEDDSDPEAIKGGEPTWEKGGGPFCRG